MKHLTFRTRSAHAALAGAFLAAWAGTAGASQIAGGSIGTVLPPSSTSTHVGPTVAPTATPAKNTTARAAQPAKAASTPKR